MNREAVMRELWLRVGRSETSLAALQVAREPEEIDRAWESYLSEFGRLVNRLISAAMEEKQTRSWAHRLKNYSNGQDKGLQYLREARNDLEHGLVPTSRADPALLSLAGGTFEFSGGTIAMSNCSVNGQPVNFFGKVDNGKLVREPQENLPNGVRELPPRIVLKSVTNLEKKLTVHPPTHLMGQKLETGCPISLALAGLSFAKQHTNDFERMYLSN